MKHELIIDSFAGGGGASLGIAWALGRCPDIAINHDESAIAMHAANHPNTEHVLEDVWKADLRELVGDQEVGLLWASPDCFAAGTLVISKRGLIPIEQVVIGDFVLTHQNRWRPVTALVSKESETIRLKGHGHYGLDVTPDHQFYSQTFAYRDVERGGVCTKVKRTNGVKWIQAGKMVGQYWATPHSVPATEMTLPPAELSSRFFYVLGRWVACGSFSKDDIVISCGWHDADEMLDWIQNAGLVDSDGRILNIRWRDLDDTRQIIIGNAELRRWIQSEFGRLSRSKRLPVWLLSIQKSWRESFLNGYVDGDGYVAPAEERTAKRVEAGTTSKSLAVGIRLLAVSLGKSPSMYKCVQSDSEIDGRTIKGGDYYRVMWSDGNHEGQFIDDSRHRFTAVKSINEGSRQLVYCIEVEEDHSFVADGFVVHNCKHFSRAKGGKPVEKRIRSLAWIVCRWADQVRPRVIALENVREFADWGPLVPRWSCSSCGWKGTEGQTVLARTRRKCPSCESRKLVITEDLVPCPKRKGLTFRRFVGRLRNLGYDVQWRNLDAADYGSPTHRKRLFLIARCDGQTIVWPEPTHASPEKLDSMPLFDRLQPYRTAAECIDWSIECPSIFDRVRPLADKTMRRIALGIKRYVLENPSPFVVQTSHTGTTGRGSYVWSTDEPTRTISQSNEFGIVTPIVSRYNGSKSVSDDRCQEVDRPVSTLDTQPRFAVVAPIVTQIAHGEGGQGRWGTGSKEVTEPLGTVAGSNNHSVVAATLLRQFGKSDAVDVEQPMPTTTAGGGGKTGLLAATLVQSGYGERDGQSPRVLDIQQPHGTVVGAGVKSALVSAFVAKHFGGMVGVEADQPLPTTTMRGTQNQLVAANLVHLNQGEKQWSGCDEPSRTVTTGNHAALVYSFLVKYFGTAIGANLVEPAPTATGKDRFGLVTVMIGGEPYVIVDIGMRMLTPRELARAQGFPDTYQLTGTKTSQVARIGNSVCPQVAAAIVKANCMEGVAALCQ